MRVVGSVWSGGGVICIFVIFLDLWFLFLLVEGLFCLSVVLGCV